LPRVRPLSQLWTSTAVAEATRGDGALWPEYAGVSNYGTEKLIVGLIPAATGITDPDLRQALTERAALIEQRADALVSRAIATREPWIARLGPPPIDPGRCLLWQTSRQHRRRVGLPDGVGGSVTPCRSR
jgi:hypothetical protein